MAHRERFAKERPQIPVARPSGYFRVAETERSQLTPGDHTVLPLGKSGNGMPIISGALCVSHRHIRRTGNKFAP